MRCRNILRTNDDNGRPMDIPCELDEGHQGDHEAKMVWFDELDLDLPVVEAVEKRAGASILMWDDQGKYRMHDLG